MDTTNRVPNVPLGKFKRTKIIATVGPATSSYETILSMIKAGANGLRLNFSHGGEAERIEQIKWIRQAANEYGKPVAIIQDLQGPKMRLGDFEGSINVVSGQDLAFKYEADFGRTGWLPTQYDLSNKVKRGERLYLFDGKIRTVITGIKDGVVWAKAENSGLLVKRKGINLPDTDFEGDIITTKDRKDIAFGSQHGVDYVALSFVQNVQDIIKLRTILKNLGSEAKIIAKIETKVALDNIDRIVQEADAVMVARGDLAIETTPESVPLVQRQIIGLGRRYATPTIVATQMLASMTEAVQPTRAEVSDVATAVLLGTDAVMLSDETASGQHPIESVKVMKRIIKHTQTSALDPINVAKTSSHERRQEAVSLAIIKLAQNIGASAIVAETQSGATALQIASHRSPIPVIAVTASNHTAQQLAIVYGTKSYVRPVDPMAATKLTNWLKDNKVLKAGDMVVTASGQYPGVGGTTDTIKVRLL